MTLSALADSAIVLAFGEAVDDAMLARVHAVATVIRQHAPAGVVDVVPAFASVTVFYEIARGANYERLCADLEALAAATDGASLVSRRVEIPVVYGGERGPDLKDVAAHAQRSTSEVIALHAGGNYRVHAIGFVPGFAYLGGMAETIHVPRRPTPRPLVPAGSVGIGGSQTGVYPLATPGGWNLIGRTPLRMFDPRRAEPALLRTGDAVNFRAIDENEFLRLEEEANRASDNPASSGAERTADDVGHLRIGVKKPGMLTTVQDTGRRGHRASGVPLSGGADAFALRVANLLVGNTEEAAVLELTLLGPELHFSDEALVALTGAEFEGLPLWRPVRVQPGQTLALGAARNGCRGYLAIAGGFRVAPVLGSRSTYLRAGFGGHEGRALHAGDILSAPSSARQLDGRWRIDPRILPAYGAPATVRVVRGAQADEFSAAFFEGDCTYHVSPQSDRMGARLAGPALTRQSGDELRSAVVVPGTIQVPPDGQPIVLLADAQTLGGYPQVAHVISADLPIVAQLRPGDAVRFVAVSLGEAHRLASARERALALLREGLKQKFS